MKPQLVTAVAVALALALASPACSKERANVIDKTSAGHDDAAPPQAKPGPECRHAGDCVILTGCCPACRDHSGGLSAGTDAAWRQRQAECSGKPSSCAKCASPGQDPNYVALCRQGQCVKVDVRAEFSACEQDSDCHLGPPRCCGCSGEPVALSNAGRAELRKEMCIPGRDCAACQLPDYPGSSTSCEDGHCAVHGE